MDNAHYLAQKLQIIPSVGPGTPQPSTIVIDGPLVGIENLSDLVNKVLTFFIPFAALVLFGVLVWGGYDFLLSQGVPEKVKAGRAKITAGLIGFGLLISSYVIVKLIASILGLGEGIL